MFDWPLFSPLHAASVNGALLTSFAEHSLHFVHSESCLLSSTRPLVCATDKVVAVGADMPTEALLAVLSPWFRAIVAPETNQVLFRRTIEGVFEALLNHFPPKDAVQGDDAMGEEDETGDGDGATMFKEADLVAVQACLFEAAAAPQVLIRSV